MHHSDKWQFVFNVHWLFISSIISTIVKSWVVLSDKKIFSQCV